MATSLTSVFGDEITVYSQNRKADRQYSGFAGAHGLTSMLLGSRGYAIIVNGIVRGTGGSYSTARADAASTLANIEACLWAGATDYRFQGETFYNVVWDRIERIPDSKGRVFRYTAGGEVVVNFVAYGRALI